MNNSLQSSENSVLKLTYTSTLFIFLRDWVEHNLSACENLQANYKEYVCTHKDPTKTQASESLRSASATFCKNTHFTDIFLPKCQQYTHLLDKLSTTKEGLLWLNVICKLLGV